MATEEGPRPKIYFGLPLFGHYLVQLSMRLFYTIIISSSIGKPLYGRVDIVVCRINKRMEDDEAAWMAVPDGARGMRLTTQALNTAKVTTGILHVNQV